MWMAGFDPLAVDEVVGVSEEKRGFPAAASAVNPKLNLIYKLWFGCCRKIEFEKELRTSTKSQAPQKN